MIRIVQHHNRHLFERELDEMHKLRARVFADRLKWDVQVKDGRECDVFDELQPVYLLSIGENGNLEGSVRLLPTLGPNMLSDVFPVLMPPGEQISSPTIWESTRFSVDQKVLAERSANLINRTTAELLCGMTEVGMLAGLEFIVSVVDLQMERVLKRAKCPCERLGEPKKIGRVSAIAGLWEIGEPLLSGLQSAGGIEGSVLDQSEPGRFIRAA